MCFLRGKRANSWKTPFDTDVDYLKYVKTQ